MNPDFPNVYLDLDETLVHSFPFSNRKVISITKPIEKFVRYNFEDIYIILERPGLQKFLDWLFENFNVSIWSAGSSDYVNFIKKYIIIGSTNRHLERVLHSKHCDKSQHYYGDDHIKKLDMLWEILQIPNHNKRNTILLDDLCSNLRSQPENCVRVNKFDGQNPQDNELEKVKEKLEMILERFKKKGYIDKTPIRNYQKSPKKKLKSPKNKAFNKIQIK
jgi:hypothetical protein